MNKNILRETLQYAYYNDSVNTYDFSESHLDKLLDIGYLRNKFKSGSKYVYYITLKGIHRLASLNK